MLMKTIKTENKYKPYYGLGLLTMQLLTHLLFVGIIDGFIVLLWLFLPCGITIINRNKYLWFLRQLTFLTLSLLLIFS